MDPKKTEKQVVSKQRVTDHGEVFTAEREVNAMLDLVKHETERIDSRFLEPACGDGNFLAEILRRKLAAVKNKYRKNHADYEKYAVVAISSIYGVEILPDNAQQCRVRLFEIWDREYTTNCKKDARDLCRDAVKFILRRNILCGDALTLKAQDGNPIIFSEWSLASGSMLKRRDYKLAVLMEEHSDQLSLLDTNYLESMVYDEEIRGFIPRPIREFPLTDYWKVQEYE